jgi:N-acetylmuramoyl-L-alanine amidase
VETECSKSFADQIQANRKSPDHLKLASTRQNPGHGIRMFGMKPLVPFFSSASFVTPLASLTAASLIAAGGCSSDTGGEPSDRSAIDAGPKPDSGTSRISLDGGVTEDSGTGDTRDTGADGSALPLKAEETITATLDTFLKVSDADSSTLPDGDKCAIVKGSQVQLSGVSKVISAAGIHMRGLLVSSHDCGANFTMGSSVYAFRPHFTGWSDMAVPPNVMITDDPANYAAPCQYKAANRTRSEIQRIVLHNTEGRWLSFKSTWQACNRIGAAHYVILRTGEILRTIDTKNVAYHARSANPNSVGVEIEAGPGFEGMTPKQEASVIALTKKLQADFGPAPQGIQRDGVTMHRLAAPGTTDCAKYIWPEDSDFTTWRDANLQ